MTSPSHDVTNLALASEGVRRIEWAEREMPVLRSIRERFAKERPLAGHPHRRVPPRHHRDREPHAHARRRAARRSRSRPRTRCPRRTTSRRRSSPSYGIPVHARRGEDRDTYYRHLNSVADTHPTLTMDDGCDLVSLLHQDRAEQVKEVLAGTEETTTGVIRLRAMAADSALGYPVIAVNEAQTKHLFDNRYGTGQSTLDGILRATNLLIAGRNVVVAGYGWVGRGIASRMARPWRPRHDRGDRPDPRPRGAHGRLPGHDRRPGRGVGRPVRDRDRQRQRLPARALRVDARRRDDGQLRPLRCRAGPRRAAPDGRGPRPRGARERAGVRHRRQAAAPHRRGPAREPRRGRGPSRPRSWT